MKRSLTKLEARALLRSGVPLTETAGHSRCGAIFPQSCALLEFVLDGEDLSISMWRQIADRHEVRCGETSFTSSHSLNDASTLPSARSIEVAQLPGELHDITISRYHLMLQGQRRCP